MENSRYANDMRRTMQKYQKALEDGLDFSIAQRWFNDKIGQFNKQAKESRATGGDYTKNPNGGMSALQWNLPMVNPMLQRGISLMTDENSIRNRLITTLDEEARASVERINSLKDKVTFQMPQMSVPDNLQGVPVGNTTIIHGDELNQISMPDLIAEMQRQRPTMIEGDELTQISLSDLQAELAKMGATVELPLNQIDGTLQGMLQGMQTATTPQALETSQEAMTFETIVTPLNNISSAVQNILSAMGNQSGTITVSPNISVNLGGAYVFDNSMKKQLTDDITNDIVEEITAAVEQATRQKNYSYGS